MEVEEELRRCFAFRVAMALSPLALRAISDPNARREMRELDSIPPSAEDDALMASMTLESVWNRAITNAFNTRFALQSTLRANPKRAKSKAGQNEIAYYRARVAAVDDTLHGLALVRQMMVDEDSGEGEV